VYPEYGTWVTSPVSLQFVTVQTIAVGPILVSWTCT
jgi:hypothetical protein